MSGTRPFRMLARMPDDAPRDMPHMDKTFPGRRAFIPSNSGQGGRCSLVRRKRTPGVPLSERSPTAQTKATDTHASDPLKALPHATGPAHVARDRWALPE
jgi:hypothetical protein